MQTWCERQGQVEIGVVVHEGRECAALGATVVGRSVTGYTRLVHGDIILQTWCGKTMLACRSEVVERFWSGSLALMFRLTNGRCVVGYALGESSMLFRGELVTDCTDEEARREALRLSDVFAELDAEDQAALDAEEEERLFNIDYCCPTCGHEWTEQWSSSCDSECPECGTKDITALSWEDAD